MARAMAKAMATGGVGDAPDVRALVPVSADGEGPARVLAEAAIAAF